MPSINPLSSGMTSDWVRRASSRLPEPRFATIALLEIARMSCRLSTPHQDGCGHRMNRLPMGHAPQIRGAKGDFSFSFVSISHALLKCWMAELPSSASHCYDRSSYCHHGMLSRLRREKYATYTVVCKWVVFHSSLHIVCDSRISLLTEYGAWQIFNTSRPRQVYDLPE